MNNRALPPLKVPSGKFPGKYKSAEQFSTNEDARLRCALDEEGVEEEGDLSVLEKCPDEPREIIQHLSGVLRSEPRISKAPLAWFLVHRKLADAFLTSHDMQSMKSAIFHLQQALRGLKRLKSMQSEIPRAEIDIARCFGEIADSLPPPQRRRRRREAIEREMQAADSAMIHAKEASSKDVEMIRDACEEKAASCIRRFNYSRDRSLSAAVLEDAILSLTEATESASSSSPRHQESLGRLAECFLARAADVEDNHKYCVEALQNAHKTMRVMQKTIEDKESLIYAKLQVSIANVLALQLLRGESWPPSNREDGTIEKVLKLVGQATEYFDKDDRRDDGYLVSLRCLEAQMRMLKDSREEAMRALRHAAEICESNKNIDMIPNAIRYEIFRGIAFLSDDPLDSLEQFRPSSSNPDAVCVYELELARAYYNAGRLDDARAAVFRALPPAFDVLRRYPLETDTLGRTTLDAAISVIGAIVDLGVDIVASVIQRDHADKLKTSGAWLWLSHERGISRKPDEEMPDSNRWQMAQAAFDLLLLMEALAGLAEIQSLGPILTRQLKEQEFLSESLIESGVAAREACARMCDTANNDSYLFRPPILATQPVPVVSTRSAESTAMQGTLVDQLKPVPIILRTPTTRLKPAQDRSEATAAATKFARLLEECPDYLLSCIGCAFRTKTHEDFLTVADECLLTWAVCGQGQKKSLVGVALYSGQAGIFFTNWDEDCSREFEALASSVRFERGHPSQHCAAKLSHLLKLDALVAGLPDQVEHMVVVLPTALSNVPVHALPIHKSESGETVFLCDRVVIRYATSGAAAAAVNRRCTKRRDSTPLNPLLAFTKAKDKTGRNLETLLCDAIGASWEGPQAQILDADQLLRAIEWSQTQEEKVVDVRYDLKYASGVHMGTVSQGLDTAGGVPSLASGERTVIASKVAPNLFERADMIVLSNGHMPRLDQTPSTSIPTAMLCAGSNAVVTSLWDIPSRGGQKPGLVRAILTAVLWKKFNGMRIRSSNRQVASAVRAASCWVRKAKIRDVREFVDELPLDDARKRDFRSRLHEIFGPQAGNANDQILFAPDSVDWAAYACFGDGYSMAISEPSTGYRRRSFSTDLVAKAFPSHLLARVMPSIAKQVQASQRSNGEIDSESVAEDDDYDLSAEIDETGGEIVQEWLAYAETREGRLLVGELGPEKTWRRANRRRHMTKAIRRAIKSGGQEALAIARESRNKAIELREKFRDAGGDEAIVRAKENILSKTGLALLAAQRQADRLAESQAVHNFYHHPVVVKVGNSAVVKKSKYAIVVGKERTIALARKGKQRCIAAREQFREAGGDEAVIRAREKILATTKRLAISARDELGKLRRSRVLLKSGLDDPTNEKEAVRDSMPS